jgi:hypothetical protein
MVILLEQVGEVGQSSERWSSSSLETGDCRRSQSRERLSTDHRRGQRELRRYILYLENTPSTPLISRETTNDEPLG